MLSLHGRLRSDRAVVFLATLLAIFLAGHLLLRLPSVPEELKVSSKEIIASSTASSTAVLPPAPTPPANTTSADGKQPDGQWLPCRGLDGADDVQVVMRTGATEIQDKLPVHFKTTFRCYPNLVIFSDFQESMQGHEIHDVLTPIDNSTKQNNDDFALYLRLQDQGREALDRSELSGEAAFESGPTGKVDNAGWRLDKWKFLPMMIRTLELRPDKKWYVFVEPDTYLVWSNLLQWLSKLDSRKAQYFGSEVMIGDDLFAHGGSAFVMSKPAVEKAAKIYEETSYFWHGFVAGHWAGDCVLGKALNDAGVPLTWSWPMFQGGNPATMDFKEEKGDDRRLWCSPALSYHHLSPWEVGQMWEFEQRWIDKHRQAASSFGSIWEDKSPRLRHQDVFKEYTLPNITRSRQDWINWAPLKEEVSENDTFEDCEKRCHANSECVQFYLNDEGCYLGYDPKLGQPFAHVRSGWIAERVEAWMHSFEKCSKNGDWTAP